MKTNNKKLLIVGAGMYSAVAFEIATEMNCFSSIAFIDDQKETTPLGQKVIGTMNDFHRFCSDYNCIVVAIGNPDKRKAIIKRIKEETTFQIISLISPKAHISPSSSIMNGCIIEPMAVIHSKCHIAEGCLISAGAVVNHASTCLEYVHVDCNATVDGYVTVPEKLKIFCGEIYTGKA